MGLDSEKFSAARGASGMTFEQISSAAGVGSTSTYMTHERHPEQFRLKEITGMYCAMNEPARQILKQAVMDIFLDN